MYAIANSTWIMACARASVHQCMRSRRWDRSASRTHNTHAHQAMPDHTSHNNTPHAPAHTDHTPSPTALGDRESTPHQAPRSDTIRHTAAACPSARAHRPKRRQKRNSRKLRAIPDGATCAFCPQAAAACPAAGWWTFFLAPYLLFRHLLNRVMAPLIRPRHTTGPGKGFWLQPVVPQSASRNGRAQRRKPQPMRDPGATTVTGAPRRRHGTRQRPVRNTFQARWLHLHREDTPHHPPASATPRGNHLRHKRGAISVLINSTRGLAWEQLPRHITMRHVANHMGSQDRSLQRSRGDTWHPIRPSWRLAAAQAKRGTTLPD